MQAYFQLNVKNAQIRSPMTRVAMCLSNMEGPEVEEWERDLGVWFNSLNPNTDDCPGVWQTFEQEFQEQFEDSQWETGARMELQKSKRRYHMLHQPEGANRTENQTNAVLPDQLRESMTNPRVSMVCSHATTDQL